MMDKLLKDFNRSQITRQVNYILIPITIVKPCEEGVKKFNNILDEIKLRGYNKITRCIGGGISIKKEHFIPPMYDVRALNSCVELTVITCNYCYRVQFRQDFSVNKENKISGHTAFKEFLNQLKSDNVDLNKYAIKNGLEIKNKIEKQMRLLLPFRENKVYTNAHHIDLNSAYMAGVAILFPELQKTINRIYVDRKVKPINKGILTHTWGFMQSKIIDYKFSHISKAGIEWTNNKLEDLAKKLEDNGRFIIAFNADGIWYSGEIFHGEGEGTGLGEWKNDHINCTIKFKSIACYGYFEDNNFNVVASGKYALDKIKPREEWTMADLDNLGESWLYFFDKKDEKIRLVKDE